MIHGSLYEARKYVKPIFSTIISGNEKAFNEEISKRIRRYRKKMDEYSPIIDYPSIALIKVAKLYGIQCNVNAVEITECFLEPIDLSIFENLHIPLEEEVIQILNSDEV